MCRVQVKAKNERQNDDYATANTNPNSSSLNDEAHHIRRRLSQTISSRSCLLIAIALASLSAHACSDTVELQVTCDSSVTPWYVTSSDASGENTTVTVGSCIDGRVADIARVESEDIDDNGIVICSESDVDVCYHLKWSNSNQIDVKNCDNYDDPKRTYYCDNGVPTFKNDKSHDITASDTCFSSNNVSHNYECKENIVRKIPCQYGCADDHKGCKQNPDLTDKCTANDIPICEGKTIKICENNKWVSTGIQSTCQKANGSGIMYECQDSGEAEATPIETTCPLGCDENGDKCKHYQEESCSNSKTKCAGDLKGRVDCDGKIIEECQYCYNESIENNFTSIEKLGCDGCVPNKYDRGDSNESIFSTMNSICHNGKESKFGKIENRNFLFIPETNSNDLWEFALNVTVALPKVQPQNPPIDQLPKPLQPTWQYYNCHNDVTKGQLIVLNQNQNTKTASVFLSELMSLNKCCDDENSYYITQTGYRYYSVEKCTNIALHDTSNSAIKPTNFSAYAYTTELNDSLIGIEDDLLAKDSACLKTKDTSNAGGEADVRHMMFIKQQPDGKSNYGIYKAFECPENYKCDEKLNRLCISNPPQCDSNCKCKNIANVYTILCGNKTIAACPKGTKLRIVGDDVEFSCDDQSSFTLDQIQCVPDGQLTSEQ